MKTIFVIALLLPLSATQARDPFQLREGDVVYQHGGGYPMPHQVRFGYLFRPGGTVVLFGDDSVGTIADPQRNGDAIRTGWNDLKRRVAGPDTVGIADGGWWTFRTPDDSILVTSWMLLNNHLDPISLAAFDAIRVRCDSMEARFRNADGARVVDSILAGRSRISLASSNASIARRRAEGREIPADLLRRRDVEMELLGKMTARNRAKYGSELLPAQADSGAGKP